MGLRSKVRGARCGKPAHGPAFLADGRIEMDSNTVEREIRTIKLPKNNSLFADHDLAQQAGNAFVVLQHLQIELRQS